MSYHPRPTQAPRPKTRAATCCKAPRIIGVACLTCGKDQQKRRPLLQRLPDQNAPEQI